MVSLSGFNAQEVEPLGEYSPLPAGEYPCVITATEEKQTKSGNGSFLEFRFDIVDGEHKGRLLFARLNLKNPNQQAVNIARAELSSICRAVGVLTPQSSESLHNIPLLVKVALKKRDDNGEMTNEIKGYRSMKSSPTQQPQPQEQAAKPAWM